MRAALGGYLGALDRDMAAVPGAPVAVDGVGPDGRRADERKGGCQSCVEASDWTQDGPPWAR